MRQPEVDSTAVNERVSFDKIKSLWGIIAGARAKQYHAFLPQIPTSDELTAVAKALDKPRIDHVVLGRLVPPYMTIPDELVERLKSYFGQGRNMVAYADNECADRLDPLKGKDIGIPLEITCIDKPSFRGFVNICRRHQMDPEHTAVIGSSPVTDIPLVEKGEDPFFPLNILVKPVPPQKKLIESCGQYFRSRFSYTIDLVTVGVVRLRNRNMLRGIDIGS